MSRIRLLNSRHDIQFPETLKDFGATAALIDEVPTAIEAQLLVALARFLGTLKSVSFYGDGEQLDNFSGTHESHNPLYSSLDFGIILI
jgi:hypothetical protein